MDCRWEQDVRETLRGQPKVSAVEVGPRHSIHDFQLPDWGFAHCYGLDLKSLESLCFEGFLLSAGGSAGWWPHGWGDALGDLELNGLLEVGADFRGRVNWKEKGIRGRPLKCIVCPCPFSLSASSYSKTSSLALLQPAVPTMMFCLTTDPATLETGSHGWKCLEPWVKINIFFF